MNMSLNLKKARLAAELAQEQLIDALKLDAKDSAFIRTLILNCRLLSYAATRFLWAKKMVDRWDYSLRE